MMTIKELYSYILEEETPTIYNGFFAENTISSSFPNVKIIKEVYQALKPYKKDIDLAFYNLYSSRDTICDTYFDWVRSVQAMLRMNEYKYNELYETMLVEYNKMENYDMIETGTDTTKKTGTIDNTGNSSNGAHTDTVNTTLGSVTNSSSVAIGEQNETTTHKVRPFNDSDTSYIANSDETKRNSHTDTTNETLGSQTNTSSNQYGAQQNTNNNLETFDTTDETTHTFSRHGNIGVLSGQQLVEQSRKVAMFSIWSEIFKDINNTLLGGFV
ncbi:MAG: hypothetical protein Q4A15_01025 [Prevotellaceae bacterium]|nr:hypothetical protein [Prevotellaceae bacterium]